MEELKRALFAAPPRCPACPAFGYYPGEWTPWSPFGSRLMDQPARSINLMFVAPMQYQRQARAQGADHIVMMAAPGLSEAILRSGLKR